MKGIEYLLSEVKEPSLHVIRKQRRESAEKVVAMQSYYVLDGTIYQAPHLCNVLRARTDSALLSKGFSATVTNLGKMTGYVDAKNQKIDLKELKRMDHILASLYRKLPPPRAPFPTEELERGLEPQHGGDRQLVDPIIDQGPAAKRFKFSR